MTVVVSREVIGDKVVYPMDTYNRVEANTVPSWA